MPKVDSIPDDGERLCDNCHLPFRKDIATRVITAERTAEGDSLERWFHAFWCAKEWGLRHGQPWP